jgi:hypothetical protein
MANYNYITSAGIIVPDTSDIYNQVVAEYKLAFGADLNTDPSTPQGALIVAETLARTAVIVNNAQMANQINPNEATGILLDAILALTGSQRTAATFSTVVAQLTGVPGTVIPTGSQAQESVNLETFQSIAPVTLNGSGMASTIFQAVNSGPISCAPNTLTIIVVGGVLGWETVNNSAAATTTGTLIQSDVAARTLRNNTLSIQGQSTAQAIIAGLNELEGVTGVGFRENDSDTTQVIDGVTMISHSIYVVVNGGDNTQIAQTITAKKEAGVGYNNGPGIHESVTITEPYSGQQLTVLFDRPNLIQIIIQVTAKSSPAIQDPTDIIINAILAYAAGQLPGIPGLNIGSPVSAFEIGGAIETVAPGIYVKSVKTSIPSPLNPSCDEIPIAIWEQAEILASNITVTLI